TELTPTTCAFSPAWTGSVVSHWRSNSAHGVVKRAGKLYGMSWLPGTATTGGPIRRRNAAARSCSSRRPRCVRSPLAIRRSGSTRTTSASSARSRTGSSRAPKWRSETCRMRVTTGEAGYTVSEMADEQSTEIFDDLYLGLRAGGALRKQRRGEPLTAEEREALGRWQRLSPWRKGVAIGGFAVGTFGLGFTLGGLVFGRWRKA